MASLTSILDYFNFAPPITALVGLRVKRSEGHLADYTEHFASITGASILGKSFI
jgi:hypothetical protein